MAESQGTYMSSIALETSKIQTEQKHIKQGLCKTIFFFKFVKLLEI